MDYYYFFDYELIKNRGCLIFTRQPFFLQDFIFLLLRLLIYGLKVPLFRHINGTFWVL